MATKAPPMTGFRLAASASTTATAASQTLSVVRVSLRSSIFGNNGNLPTFYFLFNSSLFLDFMLILVSGCNGILSTSFFLLLLLLFLFNLNVYD